MSYQVIARKYRPKRFSEVVGQEHVVRALTNAIRLNRIGHAYIFCGPRGTGKTTIARIFAKCLNCTNGPSVDYPDDDPKCIEIDEGRSLDVLEIDGASNNGVEQVRELRETVRFAPVSSRFKIYIIDEVHMLTTAAFNALLKTLEEPPAHVKFFFATTDPEKVIPTILSRCQRFDLKRIPVNLMSAHLSKIAQLEGVRAEPAALDAVARYADGCLRDALSALDQLISFCGEEIREEDVDRVFGLPSRHQVFELAEALLEGKAERLLHLVDRLEQDGKDLASVLTALIYYLHDLLVYKHTRKLDGAVFVSEADQERLSRHADRATADGLVRMIEILSQAESRMRYAVSKRITLEVSLLRATELREAISIPEIINQLRQLQASPAAGIAFGPDPESKRPSPQPAVVSNSTLSDRRPTSVVSPPEPTSPPSTVSSSTATRSRIKGAQAEKADSQSDQKVESDSRISSSNQNIDELWSKLMQALQKHRLTAAAYLKHARCVGIDGNTLVIELPEQYKDRIPLLMSQRTYKSILRILQQLDYPVESIKFRVQTPLNKVAPSVDQLAKTIQANGQNNQRSASSEEFDPASFQNDPAIAEALELFRAKIVKTTPVTNDQPPVEE